MDDGSKEYLLVDGYNIINAWDELNEAKEISLENARDKLIEIMADYSALVGKAVIVVFDAHQVEGNQRTSYIINGIEVVFTREGETADHYIEKVVNAIGRQEKVTVATSDWIEQQIVLGRGAMRISARELYNEVKSIISKRRFKAKENNTQRETLKDIVDPRVWKVIEEDIKENLRERDDEKQAKA
jgi:predicted RNA-binding protein with PIN domain